MARRADGLTQAMADYASIPSKIFARKYPKLSVLLTRANADGVTSYGVHDQGGAAVFNIFMDIALRRRLRARPNEAVSLMLKIRNTKIGRHR